MAQRFLTRYNMDDTIECPHCGGEMHLEILGEIGAHHECPNCDNEWCDTSIKAEAEDDESDIY